MTNKERMIKVAILNDLMESELTELSRKSLKPKELENCIKKSFRSSVELTKAIDVTLGDSSEVFGHIYDEVDKTINKIVYDII